MVERKSFIHAAVRALPKLVAVGSSPIARFEEKPESRRKLGCRLRAA